MRQTPHISAPARIVRRHRHQGDAGHHDHHDHAQDHAADQRQQRDQNPRSCTSAIVRRVIILLALGIGLATPATARTDARPEPAIGDIFTGPARIIDGDTLEIGGQSIRLFGIDTPERGATGFAAATDRLRRITGTHAVTCTTVDVDRYARAVGLCRIGGAAAVTEQQETLSETMLATCLARRLSRWDHVIPPAMRARLDGATAGCRR